MKTQILKVLSSIDFKDRKWKHHACNEILRICNSPSFVSDPDYIKFSEMIKSSKNIIGRNIPNNEFHEIFKKIKVSKKMLLMFLKQYCKEHDLYLKRFNTDGVRGVNIKKY